jgi:hypothetical protein
MVEDFVIPVSYLNINPENRKYPTVVFCEFLFDGDVICQTLHNRLAAYLPAEWGM